MPRQPRPAFSLTELLVALAASAAVLAVAIQIIERSFTSSRQSAAVHEGDAAADRLARQLRSDCTTATSIRMVSSGEIEIKQIKQSVRYVIDSVDPGRVVRTIDDRLAREVFDCGQRMVKVDVAEAVWVRVIVFRRTETELVPLVVERFVELRPVVTCDALGKTGSGVGTNMQDDAIDVQKAGNDE